MTSVPYRATRDLKRVQQSLERFDRHEGQVVLVSLDHTG